MQKVFFILIACKNSNESSLFKDKLQSENCDVSTVESKKEIITVLSQKKIDILVLDLIFDDFDSISLLRELKELKIKIPYTIILGEGNEDYTQVIAFESGADDFLIKPIKPLLLNVRINAVLRRRNETLEQNNFINNSFVIDVEKHLILKNAKEIELPKKEFEMMNLFYSNPGKIFSKEEIVKELWGLGGLSSESRSISVHIRNLRLKVGVEIIRSVKGVGYGLACCKSTSALFKNHSSF